MNEPEKRTTPLTEEEKESLEAINQMIRILKRKREEQDYESGEVDVDYDGH